MKLLDIDLTVLKVEWVLASVVAVFDSFMVIIDCEADLIIMQ